MQVDFHSNNPIIPNLSDDISKKIISKMDDETLSAFLKVSKSAHLNASGLLYVKCLKNLQFKVYKDLIDNEQNRLLVIFCSKKLDFNDSRKVFTDKKVNSFDDPCCRKKIEKILGMTFDVAERSIKFCLGTDFEVVRTQAFDKRRPVLVVLTRNSAQSVECAVAEKLARMCHRVVFSTYRSGKRERIEYLSQNI